MHRGAAIAAAVICITALAGCMTSIGRETTTPPPPAQDPTALDARLNRCTALGSNAAKDIDCQSAWAEARRRILPVPSEK